MNETHVDIVDVTNGASTNKNKSALIFGIKEIEKLRAGAESTKHQQTAKLVLGMFSSISNFYEWFSDADFFEIK